jgi:hypothetical protein
MPNRSTHWPNSSPHICFSSGIVTVPLADSFSQYERRSSASVPLRLIVMLPPSDLATGIPGAVSDAISVNPFGVSSWACMILSAIAGSDWPNEPNVFIVSSPPNTSL